MPVAESEIPASEWRRTYNLERSATGIGTLHITPWNVLGFYSWHCLITLVGPILPCGMNDRLTEIRRRNGMEFFYCIWNQSSEYKVFYKLTGWLWVKLVDVLAWCGPVLRGDLVHRLTGQLATVVSVFVRRYLVEWGGVGGSSEFLVLYGAWHLWRGWLLTQLEYLGVRGS